MSTPKGRADTDAKKREVIDRILVIWKQNPQLRLGQFLVNHMRGPNVDLLGQLFNIEDEALAEILEKGA